MAKKDSNTKKSEIGIATPEPGWSAGPESVYNAQEKLRMIIAFAYLGKRAFMEGDLTNEGWNKYFSEVDCPDGQYDLDSLAEFAFDGLLRMASEVWNMLNEPEDAVEGKVIDRTQPAPEGGE